MDEFTDSEARAAMDAERLKAYDAREPLVRRLVGAIEDTLGDKCPEWRALVSWELDAALAERQAAPANLESVAQPDVPHAHVGEPSAAVNAARLSNALEVAAELVADGFDDEAMVNVHPSMLTTLAKEVERLRADQKQNGKDYCDLVDARDALFVESERLRGEVLRLRREDAAWREINAAAARTVDDLEFQRSDAVREVERLRELIAEGDFKELYAEGLTVGQRLGRAFGRAESNAKLARVEALFGQFFDRKVGGEKLDADDVIEEFRLALIDGEPEAGASGESGA